MSKIRECFTSRFDDGWIVEADYSQLEVIALAYLSDDEQLRADILEGVDMHWENAKKLFNVATPTPQQRKIAKALSFQLQYGAGYKSMAASNNITEEVAKNFIEIYYNRYPAVGNWQQDNIDRVKAHRKPSTYRTSMGYPAGYAVLTSITGRCYGFIEDDTFEGGGKTAFRPTQIKNYPVQGLATGDIVPMMVGKLNREIIDQGLMHHVKLINTVHDSVVMDVSDMALARACTIAKTVLESAPKVIEEVFNIKFDMPLPVGVSYGRNWGSMKDADNL